MNVLVVYESFFGCTRAVAERVADGVRGVAPSVEASSVDVAHPPLDLPGVDRLVVGGPTHLLGVSSRASRWLQAQTWGDPVAPRRRHRPYGRPAPRQDLRGWLHQLPVRPGAAAAAFDTRIPGRHPGGAAAGIARGLRRRGYRLVAAPEGFAVRSVRGPTATAELDRAARWGAGLMRWAASSNSRALGPEAPTASRSRLALTDHAHEEEP